MPATPQQVPGPDTAGTDTAGENTAGENTAGGDTAGENTAVQADDGLFGPASVTWRVMAEPVMWVAGVRALYLQALHPRVMRGTWQNTAFADPKQAWGRFLRTTEFVRVRTYGSLAEVERKGRRVRKLHASLRGTDEDGTQFRLDEPGLLQWVHCAEVSSYVDVARRSGLGLSPADLDTFVDEQRRCAAVVGLDPAQVPGSIAGLDAYIEGIRPQLRVTPEARRALLRSVNTPMPAAYLPLKLLVPGLTALGFASQPRWARRMYGVPDTPLTDLAVTVSLRALHEGTARIPWPLPAPPVVRAARERVRAFQRVSPTG
ncbi:MAG TPA: oxygenase MpaB family protein [Streptosporangiaceae bacterium]|nr:oxygenase MpaB family protein [Streptosporangiaceae bacterium]